MEVLVNDKDKPVCYFMWCKTKTEQLNLCQWTECVSFVSCRTSDTLRQSVVCVIADIAYSSFRGIINTPAWPEPTVSASRDNNILLNSY